MKGKHAKEPANNQDYGYDVQYISHDLAFCVKNGVITDSNKIIQPSVQTAGRYKVIVKYYTPQFSVHYIHNNPVEAGIIEKAGIIRQITSTPERGPIRN